MENQEIKTLSLAARITNIQAELQDLKLTKSGKNAFAGFKYFELSDFLPSIVRLCKKWGVLTFISYTETQGILTAVNCDNLSESFSVYSPLFKIQMKGANEIQALGAVETYTRRYLYLAMFNITEPDTLDATSNEPEAQPRPQAKKVTPKPQPKPTPKPTPTPQPQPLPNTNAEPIHPETLMLLTSVDDVWLDYTVKRFGLDKVEELANFNTIDKLKYLTEEQGRIAVNGFTKKGLIANFNENEGGLN